MLCTYHFHKIRWSQSSWLIEIFPEIASKSTKKKNYRAPFCPYFINNLRFASMRVSMIFVSPKVSQGVFRYVIGGLIAKLYCNVIDFGHNCYEALWCPINNPTNYILIYKSALLLHFFFLIWVSSPVFAFKNKTVNPVFILQNMENEKEKSSFQTLYQIREVFSVKSLLLFFLFFSFCGCSA